MFTVDRIFFERNGASGLIEWFFSAREGIFGPYASRAVSKNVVDDFVARCIANGDDGGRSQITPTTDLKALSLEPIELAAQGHSSMIGKKASGN